MSLEGRRVGLIEDDAIMGESLAQSLELEGCAVDWWRTGEDAISGLTALPHDLVICDIRLPDMTGEAVFRAFSRAEAATPFLFMTAYGDIDHAVALMRAGAADYLTKPFDMRSFIDRAGALVDRLGACRRADGELPVLGVSPEMRHLEEQLGRLAARPATVLLEGETGVGKEVCARFLHRRSPAADRPFVAVNCAAIPADLMESELFGHEKGAFTGATARHLGYAERAGGGVLFLDEIGELPLPLQGKLLRLIEERSFVRLGGERPQAFPARVLCATNAGLGRRVSEGRFREDLFYRINVVTIDVPPLRNRPDDVLWLFERFFEEQARDSGFEGRVSALVEEALLAHDWPGNARELRNRVERALALCVGEVVGPADLFPEHGAGGADAAPVGSLAAVRSAAERRQILRALDATGGRLAEAARALNVSRTTLWEKMRRYGIDQ
ncbi:DNA-binding transcriptional response regulator, NtrC family, contains REC, AAA-type ATPase, and a Fis-type DNA-binding domains [Tistlia consotensis]|uniref:DNA-binding transcriptional response regulator, NtrC family, contains REC, AAA-type ATPase, and a Fis-type DNA-binding domains n=1 Tax=Tistlia consotensis USBA 355 TaxID=560819 RepID=A0A1Y6CGF1_9PROT|nr:sigma-54 dependent transcriptional regulator [Tistlia consotensis]SMF54262.1 DNA-binding transcriptional response regulator, NtrC family, contains REC, AAA-type ATPase, and a Fis-type DNA-binding domains [Tistlia consotensis USBA 355]SNR86764.1 DNA-binding transcriptional response regulator, NtrC family, contains REC, AAA-type ATPase, and a Fis-type DNA-binding domains [Tistlia consotensis]